SIWICPVRCNGTNIKLGVQSLALASLSVEIKGTGPTTIKGRILHGRECALFDSLKRLLPDEPGAQSRADTATELGMTDNALRQAFHRFRSHLYRGCERPRDDGVDGCKRRQAPRF